MLYTSFAPAQKYIPLVATLLPAESQLVSCRARMSTKHSEKLMDRLPHLADAGGPHRPLALVEPQTPRKCARAPSRSPPRRRWALLAVHFFPELGDGLVVDRFQPRERPHELRAVGTIIEPQTLEGQLLERRKVLGRDVEDAQLL